MLVCLTGCPLLLLGCAVAVHAVRIFHLRKHLRKEIHRIDPGNIKLWPGDIKPWPGDITAS